MGRMVLAVFLAAGCLVGVQGQAFPADLRDGDIVFQTSRSSQSAAIQKATRSPVSHMGIVFFRQGEPWVLEAVEPVRYTPFREWAARGIQGRCTVKRLRDEALLTPKAVAALRREAESFLGRRYDSTFEWSDGRIYCSELVWKAYQRALGVRIGEPRKLSSFDLTDPGVRAKMRERFGERIPLEETVVSPGDMFEAGGLVTVEELVISPRP